ncbi:Zinc finger ZZ-type and EF-hand domain-containing protein 1 [Geodia barretti]|uniref:Zinc finger ZZ-type and EF-hand domain-containing protein 1 n=1 Tax=Geodia barretti TaxID=519541 RepID=A0AA35WAH8_GEOBA|nr:Zinc finger ZZ-type and EF-hand domain-containing protein 1 [Geodia barretti]
MGNASSSEDVEEEHVLPCVSPQVQTGEDSTTADESLTNFSSLFQPDSLYKALLAIREPPGSALSRKKDGMIRWLSGLADKDEYSVNMVQVVEHLTGKGVSREEAVEFFSEVDREGEGHVDIAYLLMVLKDRPVDPMQALVPCHQMPGPLEVYLSSKCGQSEAGRKLVQFLQARRVQPVSLVVSSMNQIINHQVTREKLVQGRYHMLLQREEDFMEEGGKDDGFSSRERVVVSKCYSKIESSSSQHQIKHLTDNRMDSYWQSSGSPRSHWIRLCMLPGMAVRELAVSVQSGDDSYMPRTIVVSVGSSDNRLAEIKTVQVPRDKTGPVLLVRNLGRVYQYVQINIRGCHSDGCDCRVRGLHVKGTKVVEEHKKPSVLDTMATWYINLLASTAQAAFPVAPQLRQTLMSHSRSALGSLQPLVLSPTSHARPKFLSPFVIREMQTMLGTLSSAEEASDLIPTDSLEVLLTFSVAHGNVNSILDCLHILKGFRSTELKLEKLLHNMEDVKKTKYLLHSEAVMLSVVSCSGGSKDENHKPENLLTNDISNTSAAPYVSAGKTTVAAVIQQKDGLVMSPTRLVVQVPSAENAASLCLLFLLEEEPQKEWLETLDNHKGWNEEEYCQLLQEKEGSGLLARMEFSKETPQMDMPPDVSRRGKSLVVVMRTTAKEVEAVALQAVGVFGHCTSAEEERDAQFFKIMDSLAPLDTEGGVTGGVVLCRVLVFLSVLLQDLARLMHRRRLASLEPSMISEPHLAVEDLSLQKIWRIYLPLASTTEDPHLSLLVLWLLKSALPFIQPEKPSKEGDGGSESTSSAILSHLCTLLDREEEGQSPATRSLAQEIVVKGVVVFFPDAKARRDYLLEMIESVLSERQPRSWWLKFEALCQYFSTTDANSLLCLPTKMEEGAPVDTDRASELMTTMLTVARRESQLSLSSGKPRPENLVSLLCALQASLFFWCRKNIAEDAVQKLLLKYVEKLVTASDMVLKEIAVLESGKEDKMKALQNSLLTRTLAEMLVFLPTIVKSPLPRPRLLDTLYPLVPGLQSAISSSPTASPPLAGVDSVQDLKQSVVGVWTRESSHNYENNAHTTEEFVCPSATKFVVEFDSRCVTERRYDYLEFTDVTGAKQKFDGKFNSEHWPRTAEFPGPKLQFLFHSDGSNNEWGYLFTLKAYGQAAPSLHWLLDLQLSLTRLLGQLTSATLSMKTLMTEPSEKQKEEQTEEALLTRSDLWRTLFRGGYMLGKLTRSLSEAHTASPATSELNSRLHDMANGEKGGSKQLLDRLRETEKGPYYGGDKVDRAVNAVFAALIWHCQELREELATWRGPSQPPSSLLREAFSTAEALRRELVEARQKVLEAKEEEDNGEKKAEIDEDSPLVSCHDKALFLLKFAGLSRVDQEGGIGRDEKVDNSSAVSTVGRLKQQLSLGGLAKPRRKPASFELVLSFVKNEAITEKKVHDLLQERQELARCVAQAYTFAANYLTAISVENMFELPGLMFLQQLVSNQRHFPIHYAAKLDGCGLDLENHVRKAYRLLLQQLLEGLSAFSHPPSVEYSRARLLVNIITCHLLDVQWQNYDHLLLTDLQISDFLFQSAIMSTQTDEKKRADKFEGEEAMLTRYALHTAFMEKVKELGGADVMGLQQLQLYKDSEWEGDLFIEAKTWPPSAHISVQCDGCQTLIREGLFYHNMEMKNTSFDLCPQCFKSGFRPENHSPDLLYLAMGHFSCSHCKLFILTHRFHSSSQYIDLCLGCFRKEEARGISDKWTVYLLSEVPATGSAYRYLTTDPEASKPLIYEDGWLTSTGPSVDLMVYHQQHCWLLFNSLCLNMAQCLNTKQSASQGQKSYREEACRNLLRCLRQLAFILHTAVLVKWEEEAKEKEQEKKQASKSDTSSEDKEKDGAEQPCKDEGAVSTEAATAETLSSAAPLDNGEMDIPTEREDPISAASRQMSQDGLKSTSAEKTFSLLFLNPSLYALAAVLPADVGGWNQGSEELHQTVGEQVLPALLEVSACTAFQSVTTRLAYIVTAQYMSRISPQVADQSVAIARGSGLAEAVGMGKGGMVTAEYLFSLGAGFLHKSDFSGAATIAECLLILSRAPLWREVVSQSVLAPLSTKAELHREGSLVQVRCKDSDQPPPVAVLTSVKEDSGTVVSCDHREPQMVKLSQCEVQDTLRGCITHSELPSLLPLLRSCLQLAKQEDDRQVEATWILALSLKALLVLMRGPASAEVVKMFLKEELMMEISKLASKATRLSWKWLAPDLEVVAIRNYQPPGSKNTDMSDGSKDGGGGEEKEMEDEGKDGGDATKDKDEEEPKDKDAKKKTGSMREEEACLEGLTDDIQDMLVIMQEAFQCPLPTLRALFDASGADVNKFIMSSEQYYDLESATLKPPPEIVEAAARWEVEMSSEQHEVKEIQDSLEDSGVTHLAPVPCSLSSLEAEPEKVDVTKRLKSSDLMQEDSKQQRGEGPEIGQEESFQLLQEQLRGEGASRKELLKTQQAIVILYARHLLASVLSCWPRPPHFRLSTSNLGSMDEMQLFCLLDLLMRPLSQQASSDLVDAVIHCLEPTQLVDLAVRAAEAMRRVSVGCEKRQFQHPTQGTLEEKGKVVIAGASSLSIVLHQASGEVDIASNEEMSDHYKNLSSTNSDNHRELTHIPGNTVHYQVKLKASNEANKTSCSFTVTGTQMGRFTAGLKFLKQLLTVAESGERKASTIPISKIWPNLIVVACHYTGQERLMIVCLLLRLLAVMRECPSQERLDLSALKPLWQLYTTLVKEYENKNKSQQTIAPLILRSLTELFLNVENLAERWGVSQTMVVETLTKESLETWLEKGISNVAFLSLGMGLENTASTAFAEAKRSYVPPVEEPEKEGEEDEEENEEDEKDDESSSDSSLSDSSANSFESEES